MMGRSDVLACLCVRAQTGRFPEAAGRRFLFARAMSASKHIRYFVETVLVCLASFIIPLFPRRTIVALSRLAGDRAFALCGKLRKIGLANIDVAFGATITREQKRAVCLESFETFALVLLDLFWFGRFSGRRIASCVKFDPSFDNYFERAPVVAVTGHLGNWEILGQAVALHDAPCVSVAAPLENRFVYRALNNMRSRTGQNIVEKQGAVKMLLKVLKEGGRVALVMDQNALPDDGGEFVDFFGLPAPVSRAAASLAARAGVDVVPAFCLPDNEGMYTAYALPPLSPTGAKAFHARAGEADVVGAKEEEAVAEDRLTQRIAEALEGEIRKHPGLWLWMYKRWKYIPEGADPERYPFYARNAGGER